MERIRLERGEWNYAPDQPLGPEGGFGAVFAGSGQGQDSVAVKRLKITAKDAAHRELRMAEELAGRQLPHVIPILDAGLDAVSGRYFVVMARAQKSLQDEIDARTKWDDSGAAAVLLQIAEGLSEISEDIVHRDLKPANVLHHEGKWKIADFGIARFVEEATSTQTLKAFLSPPYGAPEQWRSERATPATDIYAMGCIAHAILTGHPPFSGPDVSQFQHQHLNQEPPVLEEHEPRLRSLISIMLRKAPQARPTLGRVVQLLTRVAQPGIEPEPRPGLDALARVGATLAESQAEEEAKRESAKAKREARARVAREAIAVLRSLVETTFAAITESVPGAVPDSVAGNLGAIGEPQIRRRWVRLGQAELSVDFPAGMHVVPSNAFSESAWDVYAGATIGVQQTDPSLLWDASLWFTNLGSGDDYRWYEVWYHLSPLSGRESPKNEPFALTQLEFADRAASNHLNSQCDIAWGPEAVDSEDGRAFCDRWASILAKASEGKLQRPRSWPLKDGFWK